MRPGVRCVFLTCTAPAAGPDARNAPWRTTPGNNRFPGTPLLFSARRKSIPPPPRFAPQILVRRKRRPALRRGRGVRHETDPRALMRPGVRCVFLTCTAPAAGPDARNAPWRTTPGNNRFPGTPLLFSARRKSIPPPPRFAPQILVRRKRRPALRRGRGVRHETDPRALMRPGVRCVFLTCTAPADGPGARNAPWRTPRFRRRAPSRAPGRTGSGRSNGPRSSGTPDSRRPGPWNPG